MRVLVKQQSSTGKWRAVEIDREGNIDSILCEFDTENEVYEFLEGSL